MSSRFRLILALYFSALITASLISLVFIWNPIQGSLTAVKTEKRVIKGPGTDKTFITDIKNSSSSSDWRNVTSFRDNNTTKIENITIKPLSGQAFGTDPEIVFTNQEIRLVLFATLFGIIGASIHGLGSLTAWITTNKLQTGWGVYYLTRPTIGAALAIITYIIIRAGLISGAGGPAAISDFGVAGISALVGLMTDEMTSKLRDIFDTLFGIKKPPEEKGEDPSKKKSKADVKFSPENPEVKLNQELVIKAHITKSEGTNADNTAVLFKIQDPTVVELKTTDKTTDFAGIANATVKGLKVDQAIMTVIATIKEEIDGQITSTEVTGRVTIRVVQ
jgi:hypothetical protein